MGLVVCPKHGNGFLFVCPHVFTCVYDGTTCRGIQYLTYEDAELAEFKLACWFCPQCIEENHLPPDGSIVLDDDEFTNRTNELYRPMCPGCFEDWRTQGLG